MRKFWYFNSWKSYKNVKSLINDINNYLDEYKEKYNNLSSNVKVETKRIINNTSDSQAVRDLYDTVKSSVKYDIDNYNKFKKLTHEYLLEHQKDNSYTNFLKNEIPLVDSKGRTYEQLQ